MVRSRAIISVLAMVAVLGACTDRDSTEPPAEIAAARRTAARNACIATELLRKAEADLSVLRASAGDSADPLDAAIAQAMQASVAYSRAYAQHAQLRESAYSNIDSALNLAETSADSIRYVEQANAISISAPDPGTVEANVLQAYNRNFARLAANPDLPCNWE
ncbi:MAG TPA: hypothetical protein VFI91_02150 [Longimicrobiaceae bacterium]|nr:hypothetical protein [Longimicrobiaceae bacterium]